MNRRVRIPSLTILVCGLLLVACASQPPAAAPENPATSTTTPASTTVANATVASTTAADPAAATTTEAERPPPPPGQTRYKWTKATEADVAAVLDRKFEDAAKKFVKLKRNDQVMFCKRYRDIGTMISTIHCITEAELRKQVEDSDEVRQQMRNRVGKCDITSGCQAGG